MLAGFIRNANLAVRPDDYKRQCIVPASSTMPGGRYSVTASARR